GAAITGATASTYTLVAADQGAMISFEVTPVAATGVTPGLAVQSIAVGPVIPANTAPTASTVNITGTAQVGQALTGNYTYSDADSDPQGVSTFRWLRNGTAITGATAISYTLVAADLGAMISFEVTPVAQAGVLVGAPVQSTAVGPVIPANTAPTATNVNITGVVQVGQTLTGNYTYSDADGDLEGTSTFRWLRGGVAIPGATAQTYTLVAVDQGTMISFEVTPVAVTGITPGAPVQSAAVGPVIPANTAPTATNVNITGIAQIGQALTGNYTYGDADGDLQGVSTFRWLRGGLAIPGATAQTYTLVAADQGAMIAFEVMPVAVTGVTPGAPVQSLAVGPVAITTQTYSVAEAHSLGLINRYLYVFNGTDYDILDPDNTTQIQPWQGFWVGVRNNVDLLIPKGATAAATDLVIVDDLSDLWQLVSPAKLPSGSQDLGVIFSSLGANGTDWDAAKYVAGAPGDEYIMYSDNPGAFPTFIPGRGFWIKQITGSNKTITFDGSSYDDETGDYGLKLPWSGSGTTGHMVGNPYLTHSVRWGDMKIRVPLTESLPLGKTAANPTSIGMWYVGIKLESTDGAAKDRSNRAGVITIPGVDAETHNAMDLLSPGSWVNVSLKNPADKSKSGVAYDFRSAGQNEYAWEITLSTSYRSIPARLTLDNLANVPKNVRLSLKDLSTGELFEVGADRSLNLVLNSGISRKYLLIAQLGASPFTETAESRPAAFGIVSASPNPFNPSTTINFGLEQRGTVKLNVYSVSGQLAGTLADGMMTPGRHSIVWNAKGCSSGVYVVVLEATGRRDTMKVSLVK
ncbi:MAG: hypothetical protein ACYC9O_00990, partial [Candidatus Latescibacterota bacterium]